MFFFEQEKLRRITLVSNKNFELRKTLKRSLIMTSKFDFYLIVYQSNLTIIIILHKVKVFKGFSLINGNLILIFQKLLFTKVLYYCLEVGGKQKELHRLLGFLNFFKK